MRNVRLALAQYSMPDNYEEAIRKADVFCHAASRLKADLLLLPELFEGHYFCQVEDYEHFKRAEEAKSSQTLRHFSEKAKELGLILPISFFEKGGNCYFNSLAIFDKDGSQKSLYRKSHIPTGECYEEKFYFTPGDTGFKVATTSIGKIGAAICWDQWFPETARILAIKGAEVLLFPTAIGSEPVLPVDSKKHWQNVMCGHAAANMMPVLAANRVGVEKAKDSTMTFFGSSFIADNNGNILKEANREEETVLFYDFDLDDLAEKRRDWGVFRDRRIDLYSSLLKNSDED